jgi:deoxyribose-phosphate aldolase
MSLHQIINSVMDQLTHALQARTGQLNSPSNDWLNSQERPSPETVELYPNAQDQTSSVDTNDLSQRSRLSSLIDHTLLKADATRADFEKLCQEAIQHRFATVCVNSSQIRLVSSLLKGSPVKPIAVVGFPLGASSTASKAFEAREAIRAGAREIDMVIHLGALKDRDYEYVLADIRHVVEVAQPHLVKVILETASLTDEQKMIACTLSKAAGASFVKTSTGFGGGGATPEDVALMRRVVGPHFGVKASGGIRSYSDALRMIEAGATRLGTSAGVTIVSEESAKDESQNPTSPY